MIRKTLSATKAATFCVQLPSAAHHGMPVPTGTGFFISPDGWFATAAHVTTDNGQATGAVRPDIGSAWLMKEATAQDPGAMCQSVTVGHVLPALDFALLRVDFTANANKHWLSGMVEFPYIPVSSRILEDGEPV
jgi:serine protease Do